MSNGALPRAGLPDLRLPIGLFFIVAAVVLLIAAFSGNWPSSLPAASMNADRDTGVVLLVFGLLMAYFGWKAGGEPAGEGDQPAGAPDTPDHTARSGRGH